MARQEVAPRPDRSDSVWRHVGELLAGEQEHMDGRFDRLESDMADLKTDVADLKTDVAGLKTDVAGLKTDMAELRTDLNKLDLSTQRGFEGVRASIEELRVLVLDQRRL